METWRERYYKNYATGILISISVHLIALFFVYLLSRNLKEENENYIYFNSYTLQLTNKFSSDTTFGGGGSLGNLTDDIGKGTSAPRTISGIPVPSTEPGDIEFGKITNLEELKDPLTSGGKELGTGNGSGVGSGKGSGLGDGSGDGISFRSLPFMPRQILEVLPQNVEGAKGEILLLLKIGVDGSVKDHKVIINTIEDPVCLKNVLEAAYKSRWEKVKIEGAQVVYWIEKKYRFN